MRNIEILRLQLNHLVTQARHDIFTLSQINGSQNQQQILQRLWDTISNIHFLSELLAYQAFMPINHHQPIPLSNSFPAQPIVQGQAVVPPLNQIVSQNERMFTIEELATYDGKNGRPAYIAVDGSVYDVTSNGAWAAATHFGLAAGKDYTQEFASCHAGQQSILAGLPVVGRLI